MYVRNCFIPQKGSFPCGATVFLDIISVWLSCHHLSMMFKLVYFSFICCNLFSFSSFQTFILIQSTLLDLSSFMKDLFDFAVCCHSKNLLLCSICSCTCFMSVYCVLYTRLHSIPALLNKGFIRGFCCMLTGRRSNSVWTMSYVLMFLWLSNGFFVKISSNVFR